MKKKKILVNITIVLLLLSMISLSTQKSIAAKASFFTVRILYNSDPDEPTRGIPSFLQQELQRISISSQLLGQPSGAFESSVVSRNFDVVLITLDWPSSDPDPSVYFSIFGAGNYWGLNPLLPAGDANELYLEQAVNVTDSEDRRTIYNQWQDNLMNNLLPIIPLHNTKKEFVIWDNIQGWDHSKGIIASLPYMEWSGTHKGQTNASRFIDYVDTWTTLNPVFLEDDFIPSLFAEPLLRIDSQGNVDKVLATDWLFSENETKLTIKLRENVKWMSDVDNIYTNEDFTVDDVIFSYKMYRELSTVGTFFEWVEDFVKINDTTLDIIIDSDAVEPGRQAYAPAISRLTKLLLPEHYLNVSVLANGLPDTSHENWQKYGTRGLGTGMYKFYSYQEGSQASFTANFHGKYQEDH
jgi:ABC-type transport system substrate-binding protein